MLMPISCIIIFVTECLRTQNLSDVKEKLKCIRASAKLMQSQFKDLIDFQKFENKAFELVLTRHNAGDVVKEVVEIIKPHALYKNINIQMHIKTIELIVVFMDEKRVQLVLINLLSNAIKFSHPESVIRICSYKKKRTIEITVEDSGIEIDSMDKQKLFQPHFESEN
jgi:signal transduction histidine kinase